MGVPQQFNIQKLDKIESSLFSYYAESEKVTLKQHPSTNNFSIFGTYCWHNGEIWSRLKCKILFFLPKHKTNFATSENIGGGGWNQYSHIFVSIVFEMKKKIT